MYKANVTSLELLRTLKNTEAENEALKCYIIDLKQKAAFYVPVVDDLIDKKLSQWINRYVIKSKMSKLKIMFIRESPGVYQFGSRKVAVRIDGTERIKIRVGGTYMAIEEFID